MLFTAKLRRKEIGECQEVSVLRNCEMYRGMKHCKVKSDHRRASVTILITGQPHIRPPFWLPGVPQGPVMEAYNHWRFFPAPQICSLAPAIATACSAGGPTPPPNPGSLNELGPIAALADGLNMSYMVLDTMPASKSVMLSTPPGGCHTWGRCCWVCSSRDRRKEHNCTHENAVSMYLPSLQTEDE